MYCASKAEHDSEIKDALEEKVEMRNLLRDFIEDQRILVAISKDAELRKIYAQGEGELQ